MIWVTHKLTHQCYGSVARAERSRGRQPPQRDARL